MRIGRWIILAGIVSVSAAILAMLALVLQGERKNSLILAFKLFLFLGVSWEIWKGNEKARRAAMIALGLISMVGFFVAAIARSLEWIVLATAIAAYSLCLAAALGSFQAREFQRYQRSPWLHHRIDDDDRDPERDAESLR